MALALPHILFTPVLELLEKLQEEDTKIVSFVFRTEMNCRHNLASYLTEESKEIEVGDTELVQQLEEVE